MSVVFVPEKLRGKAEINQETLQRLLEENDQLIRCIVEYQNKGRAAECVQPRPRNLAALDAQRPALQGIPAAAAAARFSMQDTPPVHRCHHRS